MRNLSFFFCPAIIRLLKNLDFVINIESVDTFSRKLAFFNFSAYKSNSLIYFILNALANNTIVIFNLLFF